MKTNATVMAILISCMIQSAFGQAPLANPKSKAPPDVEKATTIARTPYFRLGFGRMAEEGLHLENWFQLGSAVEGLGKEGDLIATVHGTKLNSVTAIILVNVKEEKYLVVLPVDKSPNKPSDATSEPAPGAASSSHQR